MELGDDILHDNVKQNITVKIQQAMGINMD